MGAIRGYAGQITPIYARSLLPSPKLLSDLRSEVGLTVLFITHDIGQACYIADRVLVMSNGMMVEQGRTEDVIFNPTHPYTERLLADVPKLHQVDGPTPGPDPAD